jgi:probable HAF family extracellular repeat protein
MFKTRRASALLTIATHPRMIAVVAATVAGCLALLLAFAVGLVGASPASAAGTKYTIKDLGTLPDGIESYAHDINDLGQVVGASMNPREDSRAFLYSDGQMHDLGTLGGASSNAWGINDSGQVVGSSTFSTATRIYHAFLYSDGQMQDLGTLGGPYSYAHDVNDSGQVVGPSHTSTGLYHAFVYSDGQMKDLGTLGGSESHAWGINDLGQVVGQSGFSTSTGAHHAFLYSDGQMKDLGTLGGSESHARGINDLGQVVGGSRTPTDYFHAFLYSDGQMKDLGTLGGPGSIAYGINDSGQVVGASMTSDERNHAFLYSDGQMQDLNDLIPADSGWHLLEARAINTSGQIVGEGVLNGNVRAFLATPARDTVDSTPPTLNIPTTGVTKVTSSASGATVDFTATATDETDGSVPIDCSPASGSLFSIGTTKVNCSASDAAGNRASGSFEVKVVYDFGNGSGGGFGEPVRDTEVNQLAAGAGVPVKFGLGADYGLNIFAEGYPASKQIDCSTGLPTDPVEETATVTKSGLSYDAASGLYTYVWKTDRAWKGTCRELNLKLADGTDHLVKFQFK